MNKFATISLGAMTASAIELQAWRPLQSLWDSEGAFIKLAKYGKNVADTAQLQDYLANFDWYESRDGSIDHDENFNIRKTYQTSNFLTPSGFYDVETKLNLTCNEDLSQCNYTQWDEFYEDKKNAHKWVSGCDDKTRECHFSQYRVYEYP